MTAVGRHSGWNSCSVDLQTRMSHLSQGLIWHSDSLLEQLGKIAEGPFLLSPSFLKVNLDHALHEPPLCMLYPKYQCNFYQLTTFCMLLCPVAGDCWLRSRAHPLAVREVLERLSVKYMQEQCLCFYLQQKQKIGCHWLMAGYENTQSLALRIDGWLFEGQGRIIFKNRKRKEKQNNKVRIIL